MVAVLDLGRRDGKVHGPGCGRAQSAACGEGPLWPFVQGFLGTRLWHTHCVARVRENPMFHCHSKRDRRHRHGAGSDFSDWEEEWKRFRSEVRKRAAAYAATHSMNPADREARSKARRVAAAVGFSIHFTAYATIILALALIN